MKRIAIIVLVFMLFLVVLSGCSVSDETIKEKVSNTMSKFYDQASELCESKGDTFKRIFERIESHDSKKYSLYVNNYDECVVYIEDKKMELSSKYSLNEIDIFTNDDILAIEEILGDYVKIDITSYDIVLFFNTIETNYGFIYVYIRYLPNITPKTTSSFGLIETMGVDWYLIVDYQHKA